MGYVSSYDPINWQNSPSVATPINATNLNKMDSAIDALDEAMGQISVASRVFSMNAESVASDKITAYIGDDSIGGAKDLIILNTLNKSGTTGSSWSLYLVSPVPGGATKTLALKNADGSAAYADAVDVNAIMFILVTSSSTANVVGVVNSSNIDFPLSIDKGGTGNSDGYIRTGQAENTTIGTGATAEGANNTASGNYSHAEGKSNISSSFYAHAEGQSTIASGQQSHAEGFGTRARNNSAHAEGVNTEANGEYSHAGGLYTVTAYDAQTAIGKFNDNKSDTLFEVGNGTATNARSNALEVKSNGDVIAGNDVINADGYSLRAAENAISNPKTVTGNPVIVEDALESNAESLVAQIVPIQSGSGDPSPTNVRPISGRTSVNVGRTGKNLLPMTVANLKSLNTSGTWSGDAYTINGVTYTVQTDNNGDIIGIKATGIPSGNADFQLTGTPFTNCGILNGCPSGGNASTYRIYANWYYNGANHIYNDTGNGVTCSWNYVSGANNFSIMLRVSSTTTIPTGGLLFKPMMRDASELNDNFEPYIAPVNITIALGQTVYGGTLDVKTGELTIDGAYLTENDFIGMADNVSAGGLHYVVTAQLDNFDTSKNVILSMLPYSRSGAWVSTTPISSYGTKDIRVYCTETSLEAFKTAYADLQLVYPLANPITIQLTGADLALLMGYNRVTSDSGDITLVYKANAVQNLQDEKADNADMVDFIENGNKASRAYSANQFMLWKGDLYKVTTSIASGATITAGTNVTKTTIGAVLTALLNA